MSHVIDIHEVPDWDVTPDDTATGVLAFLRSASREARRRVIYKRQTMRLWFANWPNVRGGRVTQTILGILGFVAFLFACAAFGYGVGYILGWILATIIIAAYGVSSVLGDITLFVGIALFIVVMFQAADAAGRLALRVFG